MPNIFISLRLKGERIEKWSGDGNKGGWKFESVLPQTPPPPPPPAPLHKEKEGSFL